MKQFFFPFFGLTAIQSLKHFTLDVVILLEAELKVGLAMETDVIEEALVFPILPTVQNLYVDVS